MKIFKWHIHIYKKYFYYNLSHNNFGQSITTFKRKQCSCGKHETYLIDKKIVLNEDLNIELSRLKNIGYISIEELEKIIEG